MTAPAVTECQAAIGGRLREVRSRLRWTLAQVEAKSGGEWPASVVGSYERGTRAISAARLVALAAFYGASPAWLLTGAWSPDPLAWMRDEEAAGG
jgi:transcriptional regulator with XRE-family HTH domain